MADRLDGAIAAALGFELPEPGSPEAGAIKQADDAVFVIEAETLLAGEFLMPSLDIEALDSARAVVNATEHWDRTEAEAQFKRAHRGCLRRR
jgi:hypothetical protein